MSVLVNQFQLLANLSCLGLILYKFLFVHDWSKLGYFNNEKNDLSLEMNLLKFVQVIQVTDFVFSKGGFVTIFMQYGSRVILSCLFLTETTSAIAFYVLSIVWIFADSIRYAFYLNKAKIISVLRYNMFLVLYPLGVAHEFIIAQEYSQQYPLEVNPTLYYMSWFDRIALILGLPVMYNYMLQNRKKFYRRLKQESKNPNEEQTDKKTKTN